jgi:hypothetical protein
MCEERESKLQFVLQCDGPRCSARALPLTAGAAPVRHSAVHRLPKRDVKPQFLEQARFRRIHAEQQRVYFNPVTSSASGELWFQLTVRLQRARHQTIGIVTVCSNPRPARDSCRQVANLFHSNVFILAKGHVAAADCACMGLP